MSKLTEKNWSPTTSLCSESVSIAVGPIRGGSLLGFRIIELIGHFKEDYLIICTQKEDYGIIYIIKD